MRVTRHLRTAKPTVAASRVVAQQPAKPLVMPAKPPVFGNHYENVGFTPVMPFLMADPFDDYTQLYDTDYTQGSSGFLATLLTALDRGSLSSFFPLEDKKQEEKDGEQFLLIKELALEKSATPSKWRLFFRPALAEALTKLKELIRSGVNINAINQADYSRTPLIAAADKCLIDVVKLYISAHADLNAQDSLMNTALTAVLQAALLKEDDERGKKTKVSYVHNNDQIHDRFIFLTSMLSAHGIAHMLIEAGIDISPQNSHGETALSLARKLAQYSRDWSDIVALLEQHDR